MNPIAIYSGSTVLYWSSVIIVFGLLASLVLSLSLQRVNGGSSTAMLLFFPLAIILSVPICRVIHWYCHFEQYNGIWGALTDYSTGSYCLPGALLGVWLAALIVKKLGFDVSIKWPNDVVVSHKKICGILTEMGVRDGKIDYAVIGVGINVNIREFPEEMADKATSLYLESGREFDRSQIPGLVMEAFEEYYEKFAATCDLSGLKEEYESILANYNQPVRVLAKEPYEGVARGITDGGELLVEKTDGTIVAVSAGEVSVRGLYSYV